MTPAEKHYSSLRIVEGLQAIGPGFEDFGAAFTETISPLPLQHRGLNVTGHPVGHTLDSVSSDGTVAAEYSSEAGYFDDLSKPWNDWRHVRDTQPGAKTVYLVSSRECGPKAHSRITRLASRAKEKLGIQLEVYDARRIADHILDSLLLDEIRVEKLGQFLPVVTRIRDELAWGNLVPPVSSNYVPRPDLEKDLLGRLGRDRVVALAGMGGSGKSAVMAAVVDRCRVDYDIVIWLRADTVFALADLSAASVSRGGRQANVFGWLRSRKCLLVLDDLAGALDETALRNECGADSAILITRRNARASDMRMPPLAEGEAQTILSRKCAQPCPPAVWRRVWAVVGGHPLALSLLNARARNGSWDDVAEDCDYAAELMDDERAQRISDRVLQRLATPLGQELAFFQWCGVSRVDRLFARRAIGAVGLEKLDEFCLLAADRADVARLHDVVYTSVKAFPLLSSRTTRFETAMDTHIEALCFSMADDFAFLNFCGLHGAQLEARGIEAGAPGGLLYCLVQIWTPEALFEKKFPDPLIEIERICSGSQVTRDMEALALVETIEAVYRGRKIRDGIAEAKAWLGSAIAPMESLSLSNGLSDSVRARIDHHRAKALKLLEKSDEAIELCRVLLAGAHATPATRLLLARLLLTFDEDTSEAEVLLRSILDDANRPGGSSEVSVTLAAFGELGRATPDASFEAMWQQYGMLISRWILDSAVRGLDQAYHAFAAVGRQLHWKMPAQFAALFSQMPPRDLREPLSDGERASWAVILISAAKTESSETQKQKILREAVAFIDSQKKASAFSQREKAKALNLLGDYRDAEKLLCAFKALGPFELFELAKAQHGLENPEAIATASRALDALKPEQAKFRSAFLEVRARAGQTFGRPNWQADAEEALRLCQDDRYRLVLEELARGGPL